VYDASHGYGVTRCDCCCVSTHWSPLRCCLRCRMTTYVDYGEPGGSGDISAYVALAFTLAFICLVSCLCLCLCLYPQPLPSAS
jgi:hypothetical protein